MIATEGTTSMTSARSSPGDLTELLYREHGRAVLGYALRRCASREEALDLVSDVFVVVCRRPEQIPAGEDEHRPWLFGIARLSLQNLRRSRARTERLGQVLADHLVTSPSGASVPDPADLLDVRQDARRVRAALQLLSEEDRELLSLIAWEGLAPTEAAAVLGLTAGTARVRIHRARTRLQTALNRLDHAPEEN